MAELRLWWAGLGLETNARGSLPNVVYERWNAEHPDRQAEIPSRPPRRTQGYPAMNSRGELGRAASLASRKARSV